MQWYHWAFFVLGLIVAYGVGQYRMGKIAYEMGQEKGANAERERIRELWQDKVTPILNADDDEADWVRRERGAFIADFHARWMDRGA